MHSRFDKQVVRRKLEVLRAEQQLAFAAACTERMVEGYRRFCEQAAWGDNAPIREALDVAWDFCGSKPPTDPRLDELISKLERCIPDSDDFTHVLYTSAAQECAIAAIHLLEFVRGRDTDELVAVPRLAIDTVDLIVQESDQMRPNDPALEMKILAHPLMQQELGRQARDLGQAARLDGRDALGPFRMTAQAESNLALAT